MKKKTGFTLIETLFALSILAIIAVFMLPSVKSLSDSQRKLKKDTRIIFALEEAIENQKIDRSLSFGSHQIEINGFNIVVEISSYKGSLEKISAKSAGYELSVIGDYR